MCESPGYFDVENARKEPQCVRTHRGVETVGARPNHRPFRTSLKPLRKRQSSHPKRSLERQLRREKARGKLLRRATKKERGRDQDHQYQDRQSNSSGLSIRLSTRSTIKVQEIVSISPQPEG
jgi:hypothetical protein